MNYTLLCIGGDGSFGFFHRKYDVLLSLGNLREESQNEHVDGARSLPIERGGMLFIASGDKGSNYLA